MGSLLDTGKMDDTDLNTAVEEAGTGKFIYFSDDISVNLLPLVALIVAGILLAIPILISLASLIPVPPSSGGYGRQAFEYDDNYYDKEFRGYDDEDEDPYGVTQPQRSGKYTKRMLYAQNN